MSTLDTFRVSSDDEEDDETTTTTPTNSAVIAEGGVAKIDMSIAGRNTSISSSSEWSTTSSSDEHRRTVHDDPNKKQQVARDANSSGTSNNSSNSSRGRHKTISRDASSTSSSDSSVSSEQEHGDDDSDHRQPQRTPAKDLNQQQRLENESDAKEDQAPREDGGTTTTNEATLVVHTDTNSSSSDDDDGTASSASSTDSTFVVGSGTSTDATFTLGETQQEQPKSPKRNAGDRRESTRAAVDAILKSTRGGVSAPHSPSSSDSDLDIQQPPTKAEREAAEAASRRRSEAEAAATETLLNQPSPHHERASSGDHHHHQRSAAVTPDLSAITPDMLPLHDDDDDHEQDGHFMSADEIVIDGNDNDIGGGGASEPPTRIMEAERSSSSKKKCAEPTKGTQKTGKQGKTASRSASPPAKINAAKRQAKAPAAKATKAKSTLGTKIKTSTASAPVKKKTIKTTAAKRPTPAAHSKLRKRGARAPSDPILAGEADEETLEALALRNKQVGELIAVEDAIRRDVIEAESALLMNIFHDVLLRHAIEVQTLFDNSRVAIFPGVASTQVDELHARRAILRHELLSRQKLVEILRRLEGDALNFSMLHSAIHPSEQFAREEIEQEEEHERFVECETLFQRVHPVVLGHDVLWKQYLRQEKIGCVMLPSLVAVALAGHADIRSQETVAFNDLSQLPMAKVLRMISHYPSFYDPQKRKANFAQPLSSAENRRKIAAQVGHQRPVASVAIPEFLLVAEASKTALQERNTARSDNNPFARRDRVAEKQQPGSAKTAQDQNLKPVFSQDELDALTARAENDLSHQFPTITNKQHASVGMRPLTEDGVRSIRDLNDRLGGGPLSTDDPHPTGGGGKEDDDLTPSTSSHYHSNNNHQHYSAGQSASSVLIPHHRGAPAVGPSIPISFPSQEDQRQQQDHLRMLRSEAILDCQRKLEITIKKKNPTTSPKHSPERNREGDDKVRQAPPTTTTYRTMRELSVKAFTNRRRREREERLLASTDEHAHLKSIRGLRRLIIQKRQWRDRIQHHRFVSIPSRKLADCVQRIGRGYCERKNVLDMWSLQRRRSDAAKILQRFVRCVVLVKAVNGVFQRKYKCLVAMKKKVVADVDTSYKFIEKRLLMERSFMTLIQRFARSASSVVMVDTRRVVYNTKPGMIILKALRQLVARKKLRERRFARYHVRVAKAEQQEETNEAALTIQRVFKSHRIRSQVYVPMKARVARERRCKELSTQQMQAATRIQRTWRYHAAQKKALELKRLRVVQLRRQEEQQLQAYSATIIARFMRGYLARKHFKQFREAAIRAQIEALQAKLAKNNEEQQPSTTVSVKTPPTSTAHHQADGPTLSATKHTSDSPEPKEVDGSEQQQPSSKAMRAHEAIEAAAAVSSSKSIRRAWEQQAKEQRFERMSDAPGSGRRKVDSAAYRRSNSPYQQQANQPGDSQVEADMVALLLDDHKRLLQMSDDGKEERSAMRRASSGSMHRHSPVVGGSGSAIPLLDDDDAAHHAAMISHQHNIDALMQRHPVLATYGHSPYRERNSPPPQFEAHKSLANSRRSSPIQDEGSFTLADNNPSSVGDPDGAAATHVDEQHHSSTADVDTSFLLQMKKEELRQIAKAKVALRNKTAEIQHADRMRAVAAKRRLQSALQDQDAIVSAAENMEEWRQRNEPPTWLDPRSNTSHHTASTISQRQREQQRVRPRSAPLRRVTNTSDHHLDEQQSAPTHHDNSSHHVPPQTVPLSSSRRNIRRPQSAGGTRSSSSSLHRTAGRLQASQPQRTSRSFVHSTLRSIEANRIATAAIFTQQGGGEDVAGSQQQPSKAAGSPKASSTPNTANHSKGSKPNPQGKQLSAADAAALDSELHGAINDVVVSRSTVRIDRTLPGFKLPKHLQGATSCDYHKPTLRDGDRLSSAGGFHAETNPHRR